MNNGKDKNRMKHQRQKERQPKNKRKELSLTDLILKNAFRVRASNRTKGN